MLNWLIGTLFMAFPLLLPIFILMIARKIGYRWPAQRLFMRVALAFYAISLVLIGGHAAETGLGLQEFFNAYYGAASDATLLYYLGLACQILAIVALMFVVNWKVIRLYYGEDWKAPAGFITKEGGVARQGRQCRRCSTRSQRRRTSQKGRQDRIIGVRSSLPCVKRPQVSEPAAFLYSVTVEEMLGFAHQGAAFSVA